MQVPETNGDWTGVVLAACIALALIAGLFLVQRVLRAWIRWRTGFSNRLPRVGFRSEDGLPVDDHCLEQPASDTVQTLPQA